MKIRLSLFCLALLVLMSGNKAGAQLVDPYCGGCNQPAFQSVSGNLLRPGLPGRLWFESNYADAGKGYEGSYLSVGAKSRLFQDRLDGRWLMESQLHHSLEDGGGLFANIGVQRVFSIEAARTDVAVGVFYDYDGDDQQDFSNGFHQIGINGSIKTPKWDLIGNGYLPVGTNYYTLGDPFGQTCFVDNRIVSIPGIESALEGFDVTLRMRPRQLAFVNGTFDVGAYHYSSDVVDAFAGGRLRLGFQVLRGLIVSAEVNQDDRFDTTGVVSLGWMFGAHTSGYGNEWAGLARDLEPTVREDHITRFSQDVRFVYDPDTGLPYRVVHADNTGDPVGGDGTYENPFATLKEAEAGSGTDDIIFVHQGDGTDNGYSDGVILKNNQFLLSSGGEQYIPSADGTRVLLSGKPGEFQATISNAGGNEVVRLANNNYVGGLNIDGTGANFGIFGAGVTDGEINGNIISGATLDGIGLQNVSGDWNFANNNINGNLRDGIFINGAFDSNSTFTFDSNNISGNGVDGVHMRNYDAELVQFVDNVTNNNGRHGVFLENALNGDGTGNDVEILRHEADNNGGDGIRIDGGNGNLMVANVTSTNNSGNGLFIRNWTDPLVGDSTFIGGISGGLSRFNNNGIGVTLLLDVDGLQQDVLFTGNEVNGNNRGMLVTVDGFSTMNLSILENDSFNNNRTEAIRMSVDNSGIINNLIENTGALLPMVGNNIDGGATISYVLDGPGGDPASEINSVVRNVDINTAAGTNVGIQVEGFGNSVIDLLVEDSLVNAGLGLGIDLDNNDNGLVNRTYFDNLTIRADGGIFGQSRDGTRWDFSLVNSDLQSNGNLAGAQDFTDLANYTPYQDTAGDFGIILQADGGGVVGDSDNLTRLNLNNNLIQDFTFEGVSIVGTGDAQILANINANVIQRNGPGLDNDPDGDGIFEGPNSLIPNPFEFLFHDGMEIISAGNAVISARVDNNQFLNNFERGLTVQTVGQGTINMTMSGNSLSNDIGGDNTNPANVILGQNFLDMEVLNSATGNICIGMSANTFRLGVLFDQAGSPIPGRPLQVGLDGASNGFTNADLDPLEVGFVTFGLCDGLVTAEELFFQVTGGFPAPSH